MGILEEQLRGESLADYTNNNLRIALNTALYTNTADMWSRYLQQQGYTGSVADMMAKWWEDYSVPVAFRNYINSGLAIPAHIINDDGQLAPYVTFTRSSTATRYNSAGLLETVAIGIPRYDYDPTTVTRANYLTWSEDFTKWQNATGVTPNVGIAPNGTLTADLIDPATSPYVAMNSAIPTSGGQVTLSVWVKGGTAKLLRVIVTGFAANPFIDIPVTGEWQRVSLTFASTATTGTVYFQAGTPYVGAQNSGTVYLWGAQLEYGSTATDYIPTGITQIGHELVVNGDFSNGTTGWSFLNDNGTVTTQTVTNGVLTYGNLGPSVWPKILNNNVKARPGAQYLVTMTVTAITSADGNPSTTAFVSLGDVFGRASRSITAPGTYQFFVINSSALTSGIEIIFSHGDLTSISISQISVKEINSDYNSPRGNATLRGLLIEEQRTNLFTQSATFGNAAWVKTNCAISENVATAPDGTLAADKFIPSSGQPAAQFAQTLSVSATTAYSFTIRAKAAEQSKFSIVSNLNGAYRACIFDLVATTASPGTGWTASIKAIGDGWYECVATATSDVAGSKVFQISNNTAGWTGDGTSGILVWGAQLEAGAFATSYIPTTTAAVTRAVDVPSVTGSNFSSWYNQAEGSFFVEFDTAGITSGTTRILGVSDGAFNNRNYLFVNTTTVLRNRVLSGGVEQAVIDATISTVTSGMHKAVFSYAANDFAISGDGGVASVDSSGSVPTVTMLAIGLGETASGNHLNGHIRRLRYYPRRLSDAQLQRLTA